MELKQETGARIDGALILLIVPYGIETVSNDTTATHVRTLLIVPYGIETMGKHQQRTAAPPFNCTLWN